MRSRVGWSGLVVLAAVTLVAGPAAAQDLAAKTERVRELVQARGDSRFLTPAPGSRSTVISVDVSTGLFFFLERGSLRGDSVTTFYAALEADDMEAAYHAFTANAIMTLRATDYGWNGLGVPMMAASGNAVNDILFKDMGGTFRRAEEISDDDLAYYEGLLDAILAALEAD